MAASMASRKAAWKDAQTAAKWEMNLAEKKVLRWVAEMAPQMAAS